MHQQKKEIEKDAFYGHLEDLMKQIPNYDVKILMGDANVKLGKENPWKAYMGTEGLHYTSEME